MAQELFVAGLKNDTETIRNIQAMLRDIRESWGQIPLDKHYIRGVN